MSPWITVAVTTALIVLSAFFVVIEFALLGARRHRLEEEAPASRPARAALRGMNQLTLMLAAAQFGITACTFALGAVTKPAMDGALTPILETWGLPASIADVSSFLVSLFFVTFLHLVVGEMAPKSWAIAHPEKAAKLIGIPANALINVLRPLLVWVNSIANKLVKASGVEPVDRAAIGGRDADTIHQLVELSARSGTLDKSFEAPMTGALSFESRTLGDIIAGRPAPTGVAADARVRTVQETVIASGHLRVLISHEDGVHVIHVRDTLLADPDAAAAPFAQEALTLASSTKLHDALLAMKRRGRQISLVADGSDIAGVVTIDDLLEHILPTERLTGESDRGFTL